MRDLGSDAYIRELIRVIFDRLSCNCRQDAGRFWIMQVLYTVKGRLPKDNPIRDSLAFYWYERGPFSEVVMRALDNDESITRRFDGSYRYSDEALKRPVASGDEWVGEASEKVALVVEELGGKNIICKTCDSTPYQWYEHYNDFKDVLYTYYDRESRCLPSPYIRADVLESLDETLDTIPIEERFFEFRLAYNDFVRILIPLLKRYSIDEHKDAFERLCRLSEDIWTVFAKGVRIRYHDRYYEGLVKEWQNDYQASLSRLVKDIDDVHKMLPDGYQDPPDAKIEVLDFDVDSAKVYTPDELRREIDRITSGKN